MKILYSVINPLEWKFESDHNTIQGYSAVNTFQSVMYEHYINICAMIDQIGLLQSISNEYVICCISYPYRDHFKKIKDLKLSNCQLNTVYYFDYLHYFPHIDWLDRNKHNAPVWTTLYGELLTMKKFTQVYKSQEGLKINTTREDPSLNKWGKENPPKNVLF